MGFDHALETDSLQDAISGYNKCVIMASRSGLKRRMKFVPQILHQSQFLTLLLGLQCIFISTLFIFNKKIQTCIFSTVSQQR